MGKSYLCVSEPCQPVLHKFKCSVKKRRASEPSVLAALVSFFLLSASRLPTTLTPHTAQRGTTFETSSWPGKEESTLKGCYRPGFLVFPGLHRPPVPVISLCPPNFIPKELLHTRSKETQPSSRHRHAWKNLDRQVS